MMATIASANIAMVVDRLEALFTVNGRIRPLREKEFDAMVPALLADYRRLLKENRQLKELLETALAGEKLKAAKDEEL